MINKGDSTDMDVKAQAISVLARSAHRETAGLGPKNNTLTAFRLLCNSAVLWRKSGAVRKIRILGIKRAVFGGRTREPVYAKPRT